MDKNEKTWFEKLGHKTNPFMIKPYAFNDELHGYSEYKNKVISTIKNGKAVAIQGEYGVGKTSLLKQVIDEFKGQKKLIYYSANRIEGGIDFDSLISGRAGFIGRMFGQKPKDLILMIDEAQKLNRHDCEKIESLIEDGYFRSVVLVSDDMKKVILTPKLKKMIGKNIINLGNALTENNALKMIKDRLGDSSDFIPAKVGKLIYVKSGKNPRRMLENLEDISKHAVDEKERKKMTADDVKAVIG